MELPAIFDVQIACRVRRHGERVIQEVVFFVPLYQGGLWIGPRSELVEPTPDLLRPNAGRRWKEEEGRKFGRGFSGFCCVVDWNNGLILR